MQNDVSFHPANKNDTYWYALQKKVAERRITESFELFRNRGIEPILIKGWAAAIYYPNPRDRQFIDIDLGVDPKLYSKALEVLKSDAAKLLNIDLHGGFRGLDTVDWDCLMENSQLVELDGKMVRVLCPEDHLRVLCVHWLTDGGAEKERLFDVYYLIEKLRGEIDWEKCLGKVSERRQDWIIYTIGLVHIYLGLKIDDLPFYQKAVDPPQWLLRTVEREWADDVKLVPLHTGLYNFRVLVRQILKRIPPNPIQATVQLEGRFDESPRFLYQIGNMFQRLGPAMRRIFGTLLIRISEFFYFKQQKG